MADRDGFAIVHYYTENRIHQRLGFVVEGYARNYLMINGEWQDHMLTSLINHNWNSR